MLRTHLKLTEIALVKSWKHHLCHILGLTNQFSWPFLRVGDIWKQATTTERFVQSNRQGDGYATEGWSETGHRETGLASGLVKSYVSTQCDPVNTRRAGWMIGQRPRRWSGI